MRFVTSIYVNKSYNSSVAWSVGPGIVSVQERSGVVRSGHNNSRDLNTAVGPGGRAVGGFTWCVYLFVWTAVVTGVVKLCVP